MRTINLRHSKKGVSPIIATLLLIVIAVAAAVVTYAFVTGFIGTATAQSNQQGAMTIDTGNVVDNLHLTVYVRNTGTKSEILGSVYVDNAVITGAETWAATTIDFGAPALANAGTFVLAPNGVVTVNIVGIGTTWANGASHTVKIVAADGTPVAFSLHT